MTYQVGIDLGTTFTAAALHRDGRSSIFSLGSQAASIPSVVLLREDQTELTGEAAVRRALTEPERVAREFKRRLGDTTPIIVGGAPYSAEQLMARMLKATLAEVEKREGEPPSHVAITHPANWGPYKIDLLHQTVRLAGLDASRVEFLTEPQAAAISYATQERVEAGQILAVYDLGGGTFDAAVLRKTETGFEIIGQPEGIERMGGIDFDAAVFAHVNRALDGKLADLDPEDPMVLSGVARLREDCVDAKIALSSDTDATIPVLLPGLQTDVRITRSEFEALIRPSLADSIAAMHRALETAGVTADQVDKVLLVGGSSRIPLIGQLVSSELGRPVAVDADPKHAIALGAAAHAATVAAQAAALPPIAEATPPPAAPAVAPTTEMPAAAAAAAAATTPMPAQAAATPPPTQQMPAQPAPTQQVSAATPPPGSSGGAAAPTSGSNSKLPMIIGAAAVAVLAIGAFVVFGMGGGDGESDADPVGTDIASSAPVEDTPTSIAADTTIPAETTAPTEPTVDTTAAPIPPTDEELQAAVQQVVDPSIAASVSGAVATLSGAVEQSTADTSTAAAAGVDGIQSVVPDFMILAADEVCSDLIQDRENWACITSVTIGDDGVIRAEFIDGGTPWSVVSTHLHFFADTTDPVTAGAPGEGVSTGGGNWKIWDVAPLFEAPVADLGDVERLCVLVALSDHSLESLDSGNCWPVES